MTRNLFETGALNAKQLPYEPSLAPAVRQAMMESADKPKNRLQLLAEAADSDADGRQIKAMLESAMMEAATTAYRSEAAALVLGWKDDADPSAEGFEELAYGLAGLEETTDELSDDEIDRYNDALQAMAEAAVNLGADPNDVAVMIDEGDSDSALQVAEDIRDTNADAAQEENSINRHSLAQNDTLAGALLESAMLEASIKVVRGGVVKVVRKRPRRVILSGAQRNALKKARLKAHTATAKLARRKSIKIRRKRGL